MRHYNRKQRNGEDSEIEEEENEESGEEESVDDEEEGLNPGEELPIPEVEENDETFSDWFAHNFPNLPAQCPD